MGITGMGLEVRGATVGIIRVELIGANLSEGTSLEAGNDVCVAEQHELAAELLRKLCTRTAKNFEKGFSLGSARIVYFAHDHGQHFPDSHVEYLLPRSISTRKGLLSA